MASRNRPTGDARIVEVRTCADLELFRALLEEYAASLGFDLGFQDFRRELAELPADYDAVLLALVRDEPAGCVALRPLEAGICEMKRLFVRPASRDRGLGGRLVEAILLEARKREYERMRLDTVPSMAAARSLYRAFGFGPIAPYRFNRSRAPSSSSSCSKRSSHGSHGPSCPLGLDGRTLALRKPTRHRRAAESGVRVSLERVESGDGDATSGLLASWRP
jgi:putative acetyltransferase